MTELSTQEQGLILDLKRELDKKEQTIRSLFVWLAFVGFWACCVTLVVIFKP